MLRLESSLHNLLVLRGLGRRGAELVILRHCDLRRWGGKKRPASRDGKNLHLLDDFHPAEAAGAHHPGPRAKSLSPAFFKGTVNELKEYLCNLFLGRDTRSSQKMI